MKGADQHGSERGGAQASEPAEHRNQPHLSLEVAARSQGLAGEDEASSLAKLPADPTKLLDGMDKQYDVGLRIFMQNIPPLYKGLALAGIQSGVKSSLKPKEDEAPEDFARREARNLEQFRNNFAADATVHFPEPFPELSRGKVLTMEYLDGVSLRDTAALAERGVDLDELARRGARLFLEMIFRDGFYHADPHPGNLLVMPGKVLGLIDCGMVGRLEDRTRTQLYEEAKRKNVPGRSRMGKHELIRALRSA